MESQGNHLTSKSAVFNAFLRAKYFVDRVVDCFAGACLSAMAIILFIQVILRYVFRSPLFWSEEMSRLLFVWLTFVGASAVLRRRMHIAVDIVPLSLSEKPRRILEMILLALLGVFSVAMLFYGTMMAKQFWKMLTPALRLPRGLYFLAVSVGGLCLIVETFHQVLQELKLTKDSWARGDSN